MLRPWMLPAVVVVFESLQKSCCYHQDVFITSILVTNIQLLSTGT